MSRMLSQVCFTRGAEPGAESSVHHVRVEVSRLLSQVMSRMLSQVMSRMLSQVCTMRGEESDVEISSVHLT